MIYYLIDKEFIYLPINKIVIHLNKKKSKTEIESILHSGDWLLEPYDNELIRKPNDYFTFENSYPYNLGIIPTNECNLRCRYCYSETGEKPKQKLTEKQVENYINLLIKNAIVHSKIKGEPVEAKLVVTGGGEPTFQWKLFQFIVEYFSSRCELHNLKKKIVLITNGIMSDEHAEYVIKNVEQINLSADGFPEIQNTQRPTVNGGGSFEQLDKFIRMCEKREKTLLVRATVLADNFHRMTEICKFFFENYSNISTVHFEPLFYVGRGRNLEEDHCQKLQQFLNSYLDAFHYINENFPNRFLYNSSFHYQLKEYFCSASIGLTPWLHMDGKILPCTDYVNEPEFLIGKVTEEGVTVNHSYRKMINNLSQCQKCFAFYHCGGGCPHNIEKDANGKNLNSQAEAYCKMISDYWKKAITTIGVGKNFCDLKAETIVVNEYYQAYKIVNK